MAGGRQFSFSAEVWRYPGDAGWHFLTLPLAVAEEVADLAGPRRGFGSVRVEVQVGATTWLTSVFPDSKTGSFLLPMKKEVRAREGLADGSTAQVRLRVV